MTSAFNWRGQPSVFAGDGKFAASSQGRAQPQTASHPLRGTEAQAIGSTSRAPTASINTERAKLPRVKGAAI